MTIIHHAGKGGVRPKMVAQGAYARMQFTRKHYSRPRRAGYLGAVAFGHALRAVAARGEHAAVKREASKLALKTMFGRVEPPFGQPPATAFGVTGAPLRAVKRAA
jgi:hypothetical protein